MKNINKISKFILIVISIVLSIQISVYANNYEENVDVVWLQDEIKHASANATNEPILNSRYVVAFDRDSNSIMYGKNENERVPMASTTKIMTAIVLMENLGVNNNLSLNTEVEVCKEAGLIGGSRLGLNSGNRISMNDLLHGLLICSRK